MNITKDYLQASVGQLHAIEGGCSCCNAPCNQKEFERCFKEENHGNKYNTIIASLTVGQKDGRKLLIDNGFKQVGEIIENHNSGNMIALFIKILDE